MRTQPTTRTARPAITTVKAVLDAMNRQDERRNLRARLPQDKFWQRVHAFEQLRLTDPDFEIDWSQSGRSAEYRLAAMRAFIKGASVVNAHYEGLRADELAKEARSFAAKARRTKANKAKNGKARK